MQSALHHFVDATVQQALAGKNPECTAGFNVIQSLSSIASSRDLQTLPKEVGVEDIKRLRLHDKLLRRAYAIFGYSPVSSTKEGGC